ncbi:uncharacterized protein K02A2.6-like [Temnothorax curvispinosus]|uniref:RNA-directed DNA polymerase n=1 Tax=Temnothorax curvispinosus TaxID=300111 RepID=A0A6J1Q8W0_9HYME|nr:uncharacterized protein K02A2.6-like [Temnothorax curvispinosus]
MAASRLQNWSHFLSAFNYKVECIGTKDNIVADTLSRLPTNYVEQNEILDSVPSYSYLHYAIQSKITCLDYKARETSKDKVLSLVKRMVTNRWPERKINAWTEELKPYALRRDELSTEKECLMWGQRVIIPSKLRSDIIEKLHESHFGVVQMKSMARLVVWWPKIDSYIEERVKTCKYCIEVNDSPRRMTLSPWPYPTQPWHRIHADFAGPFLGHTFLLILDAFSKWPEIYIVNNMSAELTIKLFKDTYGLPHHVITDSGTQFTSDEFKSFLKSIGTKHTFAAPKHPATNGAAENFVKVFKRKIKAIMNSSNIDIQTAMRRFLFNYKTTKHTITNETPAKLLMGREFRTTLDILRPDSKKIIELKQEDQIKNFIENRNEKFQQNDVVMAKDFRKYHPKMSEATIIQDLSPRSCMVKFKDGEEHNRHYDQMRKWKKTSFKNKNAKNRNGGINAQESEEETGTRKSVRVRKPVERYNATG